MNIDIAHHIKDKLESLGLETETDEAEADITDPDVSIGLIVKDGDRTVHIVIETAPGS